MTNQKDAKTIEAPKSLLYSFLRDIIGKLKKRFFLLVLLSAVCAVTDGLRMLAAFLLLPFIGVSLQTVESGFFEKALSAFAYVGVPYTLGYVAVAVVGVFIVQAALALMQSWYQGSYTHYYTLLWRQSLFKALGRANWRFFLDASRGELTNALSQETSRLATASAKFLVFLSNFLVAVSYIGVAFFISAEATLLMSFVGITVVVFNSVVLKRLMGFAKAIVKGNNQMMVVAQEFLNNIKSIKAAPHGFAIERMVESPLHTIFDSERKGFMLPNASRIVAELFLMLALVIGIALTSIWGSGEASPELLLVLVLFMRAYGKITITMTSAQQMYVQLPAYEYVANVYQKASDAEEQLWQKGVTCHPEIFQHEMRFENVSVSHGIKPVLQNIDAPIPPRSLLALVGESGAGKTTFVDTLLRLIVPNEGCISVNGRDIQEFNIQSWRMCFGYVSQELTLVSGTLAENIKLFKPDASEKEIQLAAEKAHAHEFITALPDGYATQVGEMGLKLSGGQRQRIAIARALVNNPAVLIFDEATSALDAESEEKVMGAVYELCREKTVILIAHRLSTIRKADFIYVLNQGRIVEQGNWQSLMEEKGHFSSLWHRMMSPSSTDGSS